MKIKYLTSIILVVFLACGCPSSPEKASPEEAVTLKDALKGKFFIGTALNTDQIWDIDKDDVYIIQQHFDAIVPENCMKSINVQPQEGVFTFKDADQFVAFGEQNGMWITGHCLIWHEMLPQWFCEDEKGDNVSAEVLKDRMKKHISTVVGRYKGRIKGWDVVNEAFHDDGSFRETKFYEILGEEYLILAFQYAFEADPEAELYYNDFNEWKPGKVEKVVRLINTLRERGLRIDAIGLQGHLSMNIPSIAEYEQTIQTYIHAGVNVMVTELDMSILPSAGNPYTEGVPDEVSQAWTNRMLDLFKLFLKYQGKVTRVTLWGVSDGVSWLNDFPVPGRTNYPLLFDRNHQAKPVVEEIIKLAESR